MSGKFQPKYAVDYLEELKALFSDNQLNTVMIVQIGTLSLTDPKKAIGLWKSIARISNGMERNLRDKSFTECAAELAKLAPAPAEAITPPVVEPVAPALANSNPVLGWPDPRKCIPEANPVQPVVFTAIEPQPVPAGHVPEVPGTVSSQEASKFTTQQVRGIFGPMIEAQGRSNRNNQDYQGPSAQTDSPESKPADVLPVPYGSTDWPAREPELAQPSFEAESTTPGLNDLFE